MILLLLNFLRFSSKPTSRSYTKENIKNIFQYVHVETKPKKKLRNVNLNNLKIESIDEIHSEKQSCH